jgi:2-dehydropantoate 2-reductase
LASTSTEAPRTLVVGPGAIGAFLAARLTEAGWPVTVQARGETLAALAAGPLTLDDSGRRTRTTLRAVADAAGAFDLVLVCVKSFHTEPVAAELAARLQGRPIVLSMQNGVHNVPTLGEALPRARVGGAAVYLGCERIAVDHVVRRRSRDAATGAERDRLVGGPPGALGDAIARVAAAVGLRAEIRTDPEVALWTKLIANVSLNTVTALGRARVGTVFARPDAVRLMLALGREVVAVARAKGLSVPVRAAADYVADARRRLPADGGSSTLFDLEAGRRLEREALVGAVVREAAALDVHVPFSRACDALMRLVDPTVGQARRPAGELP